MRETLAIGAMDRALALANALMATELQACVSALIAQREATS